MFARAALAFLLPGALWAQSWQPGEALPPGEVPFVGDMFTFARLRPRQHGKWDVDFPEAEENLSFRLQQTTALKVNPKPIDLAVEDPALRNYPFLYLVEPSSLRLYPDEVEILRAYMLNGGFLMFDDFWGSYEWASIQQQVELLFPDRELVDLPLEHPIFHSIFDLREKPQVPGINAFMRGRRYEQDGDTVHYRGIFDDKGRLMMLLCQNTDLGDGWERESVSQEYFRQYSEKWAYPLTINILFYVMTH